MTYYEFGSIGRTRKHGTRQLNVPVTPGTSQTLATEPPGSRNADQRHSRVGIQPRIRMVDGWCVDAMHVPLH